MRSSPEGKERFVFILAESELELVPRSILSHRAVVANAKERGKKAANLLLDASYHHSAMRDLKDGERRGRPDIAHFFLLLCLDSRLNQKGMLKMIIHTRNDERITVAPDTRLPPSHHRFVGLIESLFQNGGVPSKEKPLLKIDKAWKLAEIVKSERCDKIVILDSEGAETDPIKIIRSGKSARIAVIIGGFPRGTFQSDLAGLKVEHLSLGKDMLKVWTIVSEMLVAANESLKGS